MVDDKIAITATVSCLVDIVDANSSVISKSTEILETSFRTVQLVSNNNNNFIIFQDEKNVGSMEANNILPSSVNDSVNKINKGIDKFPGLDLLVVKSNLEKGKYKTIQTEKIFPWFQIPTAKVFQNVGAFYIVVKMIGFTWCALWSAEVFHQVDGSLRNVYPAISGKLMHCEFCNQLGATVGCCVRGCPANYHFYCARKDEAILQADKKVFCALHKEDMDDMIVTERDFPVREKAFVSQASISPKWVKRDWKAPMDKDILQVVIGSLTVKIRSSYKII
ncbi:hypothetical protein CEXT_389481 [Caerostris extrusa]|uniref:PHD-type domain-containing protein n=1 Tax=Caerostris extrusa TaxID=172846 RepID=A0AAV4Q2H1_CAEEX|nr:hypothetical protein CEXT_389481 [Caerostris extrusa]